MAWAEQRDVRLTYNPFAAPDRVELGRLTQKADHAVQAGALTRFELHREYNLSSYSNRIPIGLRRLAPFVLTQAIGLDRAQGADYPAYIAEWGYGADLELLLFHKMPARMRLLLARDLADQHRGATDGSVQLRSDF